LLKRTGVSGRCFFCFFSMAVFGSLVGTTVGVPTGSRRGVYFDRRESVFRPTGDSISTDGGSVSTDGGFYFDRRESIYENRYVFGMCFFIKERISHLVGGIVLVYSSFSSYMGASM